MSIMKAFLGTLILVTVFTVISLMYLTRNKDRASSGSHRIHVKRNPVTSQALWTSLLPSKAVSREQAAGSSSERRVLSPNLSMTKKGQAVENLVGKQGLKNLGARGTNFTRPRASVTSTGSNKSKEVEVPQGTEQSSCEEQKNILLLKTHKTGSSTLQNVLYRFGDARHLTFALPKVDVYMGCPVKFKPSFALPSPTGTYNILANHARFHRENMKKVMAPGTKFITILRYPPKQFESMYSFYAMERTYRCPLEKFASSPRTFYEKYSPKNPRHSALNPMLYDLGLDSSAMGDSAAVDQWIQSLGESFELVLIAEHLKESLILLKDLMCWTFDDITYFTSNARSGMLVKRLSPATEQGLLEWHSGDFQLYRHFNAVLWTKVEQYGVRRMAADVAELEQRNRELKSRCLQGKKEVSEMSGRTLVERYVLRPEAKKDMQCKRITYSAVDYLNILKNKMKLQRPGKITVVKSTGGGA
ncbi:galactosylceramide sulfotransferase-like isoform X2 [Acanthaster planci]|uniref:Galactosylceramide sulfotransferase-like isoform X2 n=1 Tax=Acanthaster planci TaxID=133434 RepID=A0A8B7Z6Y7_ACAPL|nr:galactosylceramide sulfotransferase-like isoform X2 [Acanthaster planci]